MDVNEIADIVDGIPVSETRVDFACPHHPELEAAAVVGGDSVELSCPAGCDTASIAAAIPALALLMGQSAGRGGREPPASADMSGATILNGSAPRPANLEEFTLEDEAPPPALVPELDSWKLVLHELSKRACDELIAADAGNREFISAMPLDAFAETVNKVRNQPAIWQTNDPALSATEIEEEVYVIARALQEVYAPAVVNGQPAKVRALSLITEDAVQAEITNAEYLSRPEIIERLGYSQSIALMIGAKHHGKTSNMRTLALSVARGWPIWNRQTTAGHVLYVASHDEIASTRNELLAMGWGQQDDLLKLVRVEQDFDGSPEVILEDIAALALYHKSILICLDMLFDFVGITNELSYSETRKKLGLVQTLADKTKSLVVGAHHTPKYLNDAHTAANAALGSQGISARFSPIIFTRKWTETLYSVESTTTRDPRGEALRPTRITRNSTGWIESTGEFKDWMKWEVYADRVMSLMEGGDPHHGYTVEEVRRKLEIDRARAQNTLYQLEKHRKIAREKVGRAYRYFLASTSMFEREEGTWQNMDTVDKEQDAVHGVSANETSNNAMQKTDVGDVAVHAPIYKTVHSSHSTDEPKLQRKLEVERRYQKRKVDPGNGNPEDDPGY